MEYSLETSSSMNNQFKFSDLLFHFDYKNHFVHCHYGNNSQYQFQTSLLKVLKPLHISSNKKNKQSNKYIIIEINPDNEIPAYNLSESEIENNYLMVIVNKLHEISQENIQKNSIQWFNIELDDFDLDMKVKRPIDQQKNIQFIKILIHNNEELLQKIEKLEKNTYISMDIRFNGLRICSDHLMEEWELMDFTSQEDKELQLSEYIENKMDVSNLLPLIINENNSYEKNIEMNIEKKKDNHEEDSLEKFQDSALNEENQYSENQENNINDLRENNLKELNSSEINIENNTGQDYHKEKDTLEENKDNEKNNDIENKGLDVETSISLIEDSSSFKENLNMDEHLENNVNINEEIEYEDIIQEVENQENSNLKMENQKKEKEGGKNTNSKNTNSNSKNTNSKNTNSKNTKIKKQEDYVEKKSDIIQIRKNKYIKKKKKIIIW